jgi:hypothetical protein
MTKGIRDYAVQRFEKHLGSRKKVGDTEFRRNVMNDIIKQFDVSIGSAATAYNFALQQAKLRNDKRVEGLGRDEDKKGGRKPLTVVDVINTRTKKTVAEGLSKGRAMLYLREHEGKPLEIGEPYEYVEEEAEA